MNNKAIYQSTIQTMRRDYCCCYLSIQSNFLCLKQLEIAI